MWPERQVGPTKELRLYPKGEEKTCTEPGAGTGTTCRVKAKLLHASRALPPSSGQTPVRLPLTGPHARPCRLRAFMMAPRPALSFPPPPPAPPPRARTPFYRVSPSIHLGIRCVCPGSPQARESDSQTHLCVLSAQRQAQAEEIKCSPINTLINQAANEGIKELGTQRIRNGCSLVKTAHRPGAQKGWSRET